MRTEESAEKTKFKCGCDFFKYLGLHIGLDLLVLSEEPVYRLCRRTNMNYFFHHIALFRKFRLFCILVRSLCRLSRPSVRVFRSLLGYHLKKKYISKDQCLFRFHNTKQKRKQLRRQHAWQIKVIGNSTQS